MVGANLFGVAAHDAASGADLELVIEGVFTLPKDNALAISAGDRVFWDSTNSHVDKTVTAQVNVGTCIKDAADVATTCEVKLGATTPAGT